jgi:Protein of unknown function (DUF3638)
MLKDHDIEQMALEWEAILKHGGFQIISPEHRLSLYLKYQELMHARHFNTAKKLLNLLNRARDTSLNIFDESAGPFIFYA